MANTAANTTGPVSIDPSRRARLAEFWYYFSENRGAVIGLVFFVFLVLLAIFAPLIAPHPPNAQYRDAVLVPPFWQEDGSTTFLLGTDQVGRDILSRLIYGTRFSLFIGVIVTTIALIGGIVIGVIAGYFRGWVDTVVVTLLDALAAFPALVLALALVIFVGQGLGAVTVVIGVLTIPLLGLDDVLVGVLQVLNKRQGDFLEEDVAVGSALAAGCAVALQRGRLLEEKVQKDRMEKELAVARDIQIGILPRNMPRLPGYEVAGWSRPAAQTGGDTFDVIPVDGGCVLLLGDAT